MQLKSFSSSKISRSLHRLLTSRALSLTKLSSLSGIDISLIRDMVRPEQEQNDQFGRISIYKKIADLFCMNLGELVDYHFGDESIREYAISRAEIKKTKLPLISSSSKLKNIEDLNQYLLNPTKFIVLDVDVKRSFVLEQGQKKFVIDCGRVLYEGDLICCHSSFGKGLEIMEYATHEDSQVFISHNGEYMSVDGVHVVGVVCRIIIA